MHYMRSGLTMALACAVACATGAWAQTRTAKAEPSRGRHAPAKTSLYSYMDTVGYPQEWHAGKHASSAERTAAPSDRLASSSGLAAKPSHRSVAAAEPTVRPSHRLAYGAKPRVRPSDEPTTHPSRRLASAASKSGAETVEAGRVRHHAEPRPTAAHAPSHGSLYAFMDTVGYPESYHPTASRPTAAPSDRAVKATARKSTRKRTRLEPGYVEVR